jgi:hypothetical protein
VIGAAFKREHKRTERLFDELLVAIRTEIRRMEERIQHKLDEIDTSLSIIAQATLRQKHPL